MSRQGALLAVWAVATLALTTVLLVGEEREALRDPVQKAARGEVSGLGELSLLRPERFAGAVRELEERHPGAEVTSLIVRPIRMDVILRTPDFKTHNINVDVGLGLDEIATGEGVQEGLALGAIDAAAPARMLGEVNALTRTGPEDVDYAMVGRDSIWRLYLARGPRPDQRGFMGGPDGRGARLIGTPAP